MKTTTDLLRTPSQNIRCQVPIRILYILFACSIGVLNPGLVFAQQGMPKEWIRSELKKDDLKPAHVIYHSIVGLTAIMDKGISLFLVQKQLGVTKQRAEEIHNYFVAINGKIEAESLQTQLDVLCSREGRPTGAGIGIAQNTVDDLEGVTEEKYFTLAKLYLSTEELQALDAWIEESQSSVTSFAYDHTKTQSNEEKEYRLDAICTSLAIRKENAS